jgi:membrane protease YdiL (CAAX protease family)
MVHTEAKRPNYWAQLAVLLGLLGGGVIASSLIIVFLGGLALGPTNLTGAIRIEAMQEALMKPENVTYAQLAQVIGTFFIMFIPSIAFILIFYKKFLWAGFSKYVNPAQLVLGFFIMLVANYFAAPFEDITKMGLTHFSGIDSLAKNAEKMYTDAIASMSNLKGWGQFVLAIFIVALLPAMFEELLFRGVLQNLLVRWIKKPVVALIITSLLFSLIHSSYYLFISRFVLGYALGLLFFKTKNIWINIFAHFMNNMMALSVLFYTNMHKTAGTKLTDVDPKLPIWSLAVTFAILYGLFVLLDKVSKENRNRIALNENLLFNNSPLLAELP